MKRLSAFLRSIGANRIGIGKVRSERCFELRAWVFLRQLPHLSLSGCLLIFADTYPNPLNLLRVQVHTPFIRQKTDEWKHVKDTRSTSTALGIDYVDIKVDASAKPPLRFTFLLLKDKNWGTH